ncbi:MAG TPA: PKD domain-containing protein [Vicinamibacteria bacterium]|nr:PKD domain-containing protein [Vicinamibacteria bacterium]
MPRRLFLLVIWPLFTLGLLGCEKLPNVPPSASFIYSPVSPIYAGITAVAFNASGSRDSDGQIATYRWDFGDGTGEQTSSGPTLSHVFPDTPATCVEVTFTVLLTVVDNAGEQASASQQVKVIELPAPTAAECQPKR